jgi:SAM-dependent methyltransferase
MTEKLALLYANRFDQADRDWKLEVWGVLWKRVFSAWVRPTDTVVDLGAGYCEFINHAIAKRRVAVDLNPQTVKAAAPGVEVKAVSATELGFLGPSEVDVVFSSNFLEHLASKLEVSRVLDEVHRVLRPGGRIILMGPNIRYLADKYWDYFDHYVPLSHASVCEVLELQNFQLEHVEPRFLPYTVKGTHLRWRFLVEAYLALRPLTSFLGKQFLVVARKRAQ